MSETEPCAMCNGSGSIRDKLCPFCDGSGEVEEGMFDGGEVRYFTLCAYPAEPDYLEKKVIGKIVTFEPRDDAYLAIDQGGQRYVFPYQHWCLITVDPEGRDAELSVVRRVQ